MCCEVLNRRIIGAARYILYLEAATQTLSALDGSRRKGIRQVTEKFLSSPESTFDKQISRYNYVWQIRHLSTNTCAFATWCQNKTTNTELGVVLDMYDKKNEADYFADISEYNKVGNQFATKFSDLNEEEIHLWADSLKDASEVTLVD